MRLQSVVLVVVLLGLPGCASGGGHPGSQPSLGAPPSSASPAMVLVPDDAPVAELLAGEWDWSESEDRCTGTPFTLAFSAERDEVHLTYATAAPTDPGSEPELHIYRILDYGERHLRGEIVGETRRSDAGEVIAWDFIFLDRDLFCWARSDWEPGGCTQPIVRCSGAALAVTPVAMPTVVGDFALVDSTRYPNPALGSGYIYSGPDGARTNAFIYPVPTDRLALSAEERIEAETRSFSPPAWRPASTRISR